MSILGVVLTVFLVAALVGLLPRWSYSAEWGYAPSGGVGLLIVLVILLVIFGRI